MRWKLILCMILATTFVSSSPVLKLQNEKIQAGETIFGVIEINGTLVKEIEPPDVLFLEGRRKTFLEYEINYYNNTVYFYAYAQRDGNFSLEIKNILYKKGGMLKSATIKKEINISTEQILNKSSNKSLGTKILAIKPGYIFSSNPKIKLINSGTLGLNVSYLKNTTHINPSEMIEISLSPKKEFSFFKISSYKDFEVPVRCICDEEIIKPLEKKGGLKASPDSISLNLTAKNESKFVFQLLNFWDENISNVNMVSDIDFVKIDWAKKMTSKEIQNITLTISPPAVGRFGGMINVSYIQNNTNKTLFIPIYLFVLPKGSNKTEFKISNKSCEEMGGNICQKKEICNGKITFTKGGEGCCIGKCVKNNEDEGGGMGWIIGVIILVGLGAGGYFIYKKYKKIKPKTPKDKLLEESEKYSEKMSGKEVHGNLTKN